jgi:putative DNA primase/helicase
MLNSSLSKDATIVAQVHDGHSAAIEYSNGAPQAFAVATFANVTSRQPRPLTLTWLQLCQRLTTHTQRTNKNGELFAPVTFKPNTTRAKANVETVHAFVLDFDNGFAHDDFCHTWRKRGLSFVIYSTHSHTPDFPKFRAVFPFAAPVEATQWEKTYAKLAAALGGSAVDPSCKDASRIYYFPSCPPERQNDAFTFVNSGAPLNPDDFAELETKPLHIPAPRQIEYSINGVDGNGKTRLEKYVATALQKELDKLRAAPKGDRNNQLNKSAHALGQLVGAGALDRAHVENELTTTAQSIGLNGAETARTIQSGLTAGEREPRQLPEPRAIRSSNPLESTKSEEQQLTGDQNVKPTFSLDDIGDGNRFAHQHRAALRWCSIWGKWIHYHGGRWQPDEHGAAEQLAKQTSLALPIEATREVDDDHRARLLKHAAKLSSCKARETMLKDAKSVPGMTITPEQFDADLDLFNVANGTLHLPTRELRPHNPNDLLTHQSPVSFDSGTQCPIWQACMERWIPDVETRRYLQKLVGVSLSGKVFEELFVFLYGDGDNGKSTFLRVLEWLLGGYGHKTQAETIMQSKDKRKPEAPSPDVLALKGARLVTVHEIDSKHTLNATLIKDLTGRDRITARGLFEKRPTTFDPQFTLWMVGNSKPKIEDTSGGMWRRPRLIPFGQPIPTDERDPHLGDKLRAELSGILNWALDGLHDAQKSGLETPEAVKQALAEYRAEQDPLSDFLKDCCIVGPNYTAAAGELWSTWEKWSRDNGEKGSTQRAFGIELKRRKFDSYSGTGGRRWRGIGLMSNDVPPVQPTQPTQPTQKPEKSVHIGTREETFSESPSVASVVSVVDADDSIFDFDNEEER